MWNKLRRHLAVKLFFSYVVVILVGMIIQTIAVEIVIPSAFNRHMLDMPGMMGGMMGKTGTEMFRGFRSGVNEALAISAVAALLVALVVSLWMSRKVVAPVLAMKHASLRIADGHFDQRIASAGHSPGAPENADELGQLAYAFDLMAERLEHTEQMRSQLLGDISHELRTPLTAIKGSMEALVDGVLPAEPATFMQIELEADRLQRLVNDLQELSRVEAGAFEMDRSPLSVELLLQTAVRRMEPQFQAKNIALTTSLPPNLPPIQGDHDRLLQVLLNLLSNAYQYTSSGGAVQVQATLQDHAVMIAIRDNGIGIAPEHLPHLFTRFYRVDKSRSRQAGGGSGIGLTIARHLVEAHGGRLWAESAGPGQGSTFTLSIPSTVVGNQ